MLMQLDYQKPQRNGVSGLGSKTKSFDSTSIGLLDNFDKTTNVFLLLVILVMQKPSELHWNLQVEV
jgi:hypothetical protein